METQLELCRFGVRFLSVLMTKDNKEDYDQTRAHNNKNVPEVMHSYTERANTRAQIYHTLRRGLLDHIMIYAWTTREQVCDYLRQSYFERVDQALGEVLTKA